MPQKEWAKLACQMVEDRMKTTEKEMKAASNTGPNQKILDAQYKNFEEILLILSRMIEWVPSYAEHTEQYKIEKPFSEPRTIRAFRNSVHQALGGLEAHKTMADTLSKLMDKKKRDQFQHKPSKKPKSDKPTLEELVQSVRAVNCDKGDDDKAAGYYEVETDCAEDYVDSSDEAAGYYKEEMDCVNDYVDSSDEAAGYYEEEMDCVNDYADSSDEAAGYYEEEMDCVDDYADSSD